VKQEQETNEFHNSAGEDIYTLYLICDGDMYEGWLDISKLDELSPQEAEGLNMARLREIWEHTRSGCAECRRIIRTLHLVREMLKEDAEELFEQQLEAVDANVIDSIS
jgi:hypothetical protein